MKTTVKTKEKVVYVGNAIAEKKRENMTIIWVSECHFPGLEKNEC
jgi:hypothetical protein